MKLERAPAKMTAKIASRSSVGLLIPQNHQKSLGFEPRDFKNVDSKATFLSVLPA